MKRILVPVDGSDDSLQAVREAICQAKSPSGAKIHLLNVQPRIFSEETMIFTPVEKIDTYYYERSGKALAPAEKLLVEAGLPFVSHRLVGPVAETILEKQRQLGCDSIVMYTHGHGRVMGALLGSISAEVLHMAQVPVTLVTNATGPDFRARLSAT
ncbi:MAG TPA: universal stress protein [Burkholderiales bacterium]|jgi:nucleotide-binding universal stress UspA family protein|nr:universal stress protein [Burkholderiales bacterium]